MSAREFDSLRPLGHNESVRPSPRLVSAVLLTCLGLGCGPLGGCGTQTGPGPSVQVVTPGEPEPRPAEPVQVHVAPPGPTPVLTDAAREARLWAQRFVLGERAALLEDSAGQPFPLLALTAGAPVERVVLPAAGNLDALPGSAGVGPGGGAAPAVNGNMLGQFILFDRGAEDPLLHFHDALRRLREGLDEDGKVRVVVYGASHTAADIYTTYLRAYLQKRFGDGGLGFYPLARPSKFSRPFAAEHETSRGWKIEHAQKSEARDDGFFGLLGASASASKKRDVTRLVWNPSPDKTAEPPARTRYELFFLRQPGGGKLQLTLGDEKKPIVVDTKGKEPSHGYHAFERPGGPQALEVRPVGNGEVRLFGVTVENDARGVVVDALGIGGTRASNHLKWNEHVWADNLRRRDPDLFILAYGSNESVDEDQPITTYRANLREVLARFRRAAPAASCVLVGPGDFPLKLADGTFVRRPRLAEIIAAQREQARESGCAFWNMQQFMGGEGAMTYWTSAQPTMAMSDHLHLNRRGYVRMGMAIADALMFDFDGGVPVPEDTGSPSPEAPAPEPPPEPPPAAPARPPLPVSAP